MGFVSFSYIYFRNGSTSVTRRFIVKMSLVKPIKKLSSCVVLDLDGTLLNTGQFVLL